MLFYCLMLQDVRIMSMTGPVFTKLRGVCVLLSEKHFFVIERASLNLSYTDRILLSFLVFLESSVAREEQSRKAKSNIASLIRCHDACRNDTWRKDTQQNNIKFNSLESAISKGREPKICLGRVFGATTLSKTRLSITIIESRHSAQRRSA